jgi:hypothetical protein
MATKRTPVPASSDEVPVVGGREPCPCGSGRRYKACHGRAQARVEHTRSLRPFAGLADECDWIAMREIVPAATAPLTLVGEYAGRSATLTTVLPMAWPALVRSDGQVMVALQTNTASADLGRDVADALVQALAAEPGTPVPPRIVPADAPALADVIDVKAPLPVTVHDGFGFWLAGLDESVVDDAARESMERADAAAVPTARLTTVSAAYWCRIGEKVHLRWVLDADEDAVLDGLARLSESADLDLLAGGRYVGAFRAHGHLVPVWDLPTGTTAEQLEEPANAWAQRLAAAMATAGPLTGAQRRVRSALVARQVTLRPGG